MDGLVHETKHSSTRIHNVFNEFLMLSSTQFIENRVFEDDVPVSKAEGAKKEEAETETEKKEKTTEQRQAEIIPKFKTAIQSGM